jgi:cell division protein FtsN
MRRNGAIPPGRAGLLVIAVAMVPIVVRKFPDVVRWVGKKIETTGSKIKNSADEVERYERERTARKSGSPSAAKPETTVAEVTEGAAPELVHAEIVDEPPKPKAEKKSKREEDKPAKKARKKADFVD